MYYDTKFWFKWKRPEAHNIITLYFLRISSNWTKHRAQYTLKNPANYNHHHSSIFFTHNPLAYVRLQLKMSMLPIRIVYQCRSLCGRIWFSLIGLWSLSLIRYDRPPSHPRGFLWLSVHQSISFWGDHSSFRPLIFFFFFFVVVVGGNGPLVYSWWILRVWACTLSQSNCDRIT